MVGLCASKDTNLYYGSSSVKINILFDHEGKLSSGFHFDSMVCCWEGKKDTIWCCVIMNGVARVGVRGVTNVKPSVFIIDRHVEWTTSVGLVKLMDGLDEMSLKMLQIYILYLLRADL